MLPVLINGFRGSLPPLTEKQAGLRDHLRRDVVVLSDDIGPRHNRRPDRMRLTVDFLTSALRQIGLSVAHHTFDAHGIPTVNIDAVPPGQDPRAPTIILGAHYDSFINCPAANDNGSGVAGVLALAREWANLVAAAPGKSLWAIRFVLFANEEPPHFRTETMGSLVYARACRARNEDLRGMICLETIGCYKHEPDSQRWPSAVPALVRKLLPSRGDFILWAGDWSSRGLVRQFGEVLRDRVPFPSLSVAVPDAIGEIGLSDHWSFNQCGYPAVMVTDTAPFRYNWYHQPEDTADKLDFDSMARVVDGVGTVIRSLINAGDT